MMRNFIIFVVCLCNYSSAFAGQNGMSIGAGKGTNEIRGYRVGIQRSWANDGITPNKRRLTGYWELAFTQMHNPVNYAMPTNNDLEATSGSIVLRIPLRVFLQWYFDVGVGVAYMSNTTVGLRNLGSKWLFEDRLGVGILLGERRKYEIGYRLLHFSNAYLAQVNQSVNLHLLILGCWF